MQQWTIEFEHRSDGGPRAVGMFETKDAALAWLGEQSGFDFEANTAPVEVVGQALVDAHDLQWWRRVIGCRFGPPTEPGALPPMGTVVGGRHFYLCERRKGAPGEHFYVPVPPWRHG